MSYAALTGDTLAAGAEGGAALRYKNRRIVDFIGTGLLPVWRGASYVGNAGRRNPSRPASCCASHGLKARTRITHLANR